MSGDNKRYKVEVTDAVLKVCYVKLNPAVLLAYNETLQKQEALYPYKKSDVKCFGVPQGQYSVSIDDIFQGEIPDRLVLSLVASEALSGSVGRIRFDWVITIAISYLCTWTVGLYLRYRTHQYTRANSS